MHNYRVKVRLKQVKERLKYLVNKCLLFTFGLQNSMQKIQVYILDSESEI